MQLYERPFDRFPTRRDHEDRWAELAKAIVDERHSVTADPQGAPAEHPGELTVIGSGIEAVGFTSTDEKLIHTADQVFYCVADPATAVWIKAQRPDAYDLYVLYENSKVRYLTYIQMSEAILHYVRAGQKVVTIFYGHPGIFVLSTHRAIQIARREGHHALMRAGISALDMLCADLGVDPSQPGMQTFEATDMLIRRRRIDPGLHLVLWQVGLIGELGYRRNGYFNSNLSVLLDELEKVYGCDHTVVNYTAARYPGTESVTDRHTIARLRDPAVQRTVTGVSTWYLPPVDPAPADPEMLERLGLLKPGQTVRTPTSPLRDIAGYGPREMRAFDDFDGFRVPSAYHWQEDTPAARFILALREDGELRERYTHDSAAAVVEWAPGGLGPRERSLLARRDGGAMQIAAKGVWTTAEPAAERMLRALVTHKTEARSLLRAVRRPVDHNKHAALEQWQARHGYEEVNWSTIRHNLDAFLASVLYPWSGLYLAPQHKVSLYVLGRATDPPSHRLYLNGRALVNPRYNSGTLRWQAEDGNAWSGELCTEVSRRWARRLIGTLCPNGERPTKEHQLGMVEHRLPVSLTPADITGAYQAVDTKGRKVLVEIEPVTEPDGGRRIAATIDGSPTTEPVAVSRTGFEVAGLNVRFRDEVRATGTAKHLHGLYTVRVATGRNIDTIDLELTGDGLKIKGERIEHVHYDGVRLSWSDSPTMVSQAELTLMIDPITLHPMLFGSGTSSDGAAISLVGMVPVGQEETRPLVNKPKYAIPDWAWTHLAMVAAEASRKGGLFLWHNWEKAATNMRTLRWALWEAGL